MKWIYELMYRYGQAPYDNGPEHHLVNLVESGQIKPCRTIDLGCGTRRNSLFLAQHGFQVTGVDFASSAIEKARQKAIVAGLDAEFLVDDLTKLQHVTGTFDFLVANGVFDVLNPKVRDLYVQNVLPLNHQGSVFFSLVGNGLYPGGNSFFFGDYLCLEQYWNQEKLNNGLVNILRSRGFSMKSTPGAV